MDFDLTDDQKLSYDEIVRFARNELNDDLIERDREQRFSRELWRKCADIGLTGLPVEAEYGGSALDPLTCAVSLEALGYGCRDGGLVFSLSAHLLATVIPIWKFGTPEQKKRYLTGLCDGTFIGVYGMSEPDSGSDAFSMQTVAEPDGDGYRLNGTKTFASNGPVADVAIVFAVTDKSKAGFAGITAFLIPSGTDGFTAGPKIEKMGLRTSPMGELIFEDCWIPHDAVLGTVGGGSTIFKHSMDWERICLFATHIGTMHRLLEQAIAYAKTRKQFGQAIGKYQAVSHRIADMKVRLEAARLLLYRAASRLGKTGAVSLDAAMAKALVSESFVQNALDTVRIHGGYGYTTEYEVERMLRDAVGSLLYSGTSDMQRNIIAGLLGL